MLLLLRFLRFFEKPKKRDFLRFFALLHTFSRTMPAYAYQRCPWVHFSKSNPIKSSVHSIGQNIIRYYVSEFDFICAVNVA